MNHDTKKGAEEAAVEQNKAQGEKTETNIEAEASLQQSPNRTVRFLWVQERRGR
jgi:hypothetical protein